MTHNYVQMAHSFMTFLFTLVHNLTNSRSFSAIITFDIDLCDVDDDITQKV